MPKKYKPPQKTSKKTVVTTSLSVSSSATTSSADNSSIAQNHSERLKEILCTPIKGRDNFTIGDFIVERILCSLGADDITNKQKIKYVELIEQFLLGFIKKTDGTAKTNETTGIFKLCKTTLYNFILTREHLKKCKKGEEDEEGIIEYLLKSIWAEDLFNPNRLKDGLTLLDWVESLHETLNNKPDINKNKKLIKWLKEKGAKKASEILKQDFNKECYDKNIKELKQKLEEHSSISTEKIGGCSVVSKKEKKSAELLGTSVELLECFYVILNNRVDEISRCMKLFFLRHGNKEYDIWVMDAFLKKCYDKTNPDYIKIIESIIEYIPLDSLKMFHYEELINIYEKRFGRGLTAQEEKLLDEYTRELVKLSLADENNVLNEGKHEALRLRLNYCKYKADFKEIIELSLKLIEYANGVEIEEDFYSLLIALHNIESSTFKDGIVNNLVNKSELSGEAKEIFMNLFLYPSFDREFVLRIKDHLEIIKQAFSKQSKEIQVTIKKFLDGFLMQTGECSVSTIKEIVDDQNFESGGSEVALRVLSCLKYWSKNEIEQINYQKVLDKLLKKDNLGKDFITIIKVADLYLTIEDLAQTKHYLDLAEKSLKFYKASQYEISPKIYLNEVKLGLVLKAFAENNKEFLKENLSYIKETYSACNAIKQEFLSDFQTIMEYVSIIYY